MKNLPAQDEPTATTAPAPIEFPGWPGPRFDPRHPETFDAYLDAHRAWMLRLMERQFGQKPDLLRRGSAQPSSRRHQRTASNIDSSNQSSKPLQRNP